MATALYNRRRQNVTGQQPGYSSKVYVAHVHEFLALQEPAAVPVTEADKFKIATAHTFTSPAGFTLAYALPKSIQHTGATFGEPGANTSRWPFEFFLPGEGPEILAMVEELKNGELIVLLEDLNPELAYIQLGSAKTPAVIESHEFVSGEQFDGKKGYLLKGYSVAKAFYDATVTLAGA